jgi:YfiH family protein
MADSPNAPRLETPFYVWDEHVAIDLPGARALFTTRRGGFSSGPYASLNLGKLTDDDPGTVDRNRAALQARVGGRLAMIRQVHGSRVIRLMKVPDGNVAGPDSYRALREADGQATPWPGLAPMVLTADCLPIALAGGGAVAMLHAGWRGLAEGIVAEGVRAVRELAGEQPLSAAIGPGAGGCCYEVGEEVHALFSPYRDEVHRDGKLDLKAVAREQLERAGAGEVHDTGLCTICSPPELFFSHRRDRGVTGRQAGLAWLT